MTKFFKVLVILVSICLFLQLISLYLNWPQQMMLGGAAIFLGLAVNRFSTSRVITLALMLISITATFRYGWWRTHLLIDYFSDSTNHRFGYDAVFMLILISAEAYTILIMVLGYMQTAWPLQRMPILLPADESIWPHVDVLIPTYNEPLSLVRYTALAAINIDYPQEKLHVYILDDGSARTSPTSPPSPASVISREKSISTPRPATLTTRSPPWILPSWPSLIVTTCPLAAFCR